MYSAVLMLALTAGSETADFGRHGCTTGYTGCSCPVVAKSHGCSSGHVGLFARGHGCHGAAPVCSTYSAPVVATCSYGSSCHGGGLFARMREKHSCHGYTAAPVCCTPVMPTCGTPVIIEKKAMPKGEPLPPPVKKAQAAAPATILVSLPAGARLTVDGAATQSTAAQRTLITPALEVTGEYAYTLRAEFVSEGRTMVQTQQVNVRGGQTSTVEFNFQAQAVASR
jgi:uncharacterized protein (TIGR03000 family)